MGFWEKINNKYMDLKGKAFDLEVTASVSSYHSV